MVGFDQSYPSPSLKLLMAGATNSRSHLLFLGLLSTFRFFITGGSAETETTLYMEMMVRSIILVKPLYFYA